MRLILNKKEKERLKNMDKETLEAILIACKLGLIQKTIERILEKKGK